VFPHPAGATEWTYLDSLAGVEAIGHTNSSPFLAIVLAGNLFFAQLNEARIISRTNLQSIRKLPDMPSPR
jgi:hypothetical protein